MNRALVSIVIPVFNAEKYIERCFDSILAQTYNNWEMIAVDDGSDDNSLDRMKRYTSDKRIKVISISNGGVVNARKTALNNATGDFLMFVDADDYLPNDAVSLLVEKMNNPNVDLALGGYTLLWEDDGHTKDVLNKKNYNTASECISYCLMHGETFLPVKMYRTDLFKNSVDIPSDIIFMEDTVGILQYLSVCKEVAPVNKSIYIYFKNEGSASMKLREQSYYSMLKVADFLISYQSCSSKYCISALKSKSRELLLQVLANLRDNENLGRKLSESIEYYFDGNESKQNWRDMILSLYLKKPRISEVLCSIIDRLSIVKMVTKRFIIRLIRLCNLKILIV